MNLYQINTKYRDEFRSLRCPAVTRIYHERRLQLPCADECLHKTYGYVHRLLPFHPYCGLKYVIVLARDRRNGRHRLAPVHHPRDTAKTSSYTATITPHGISKGPSMPWQRPRREVGPMKDLHTPNVGKIDEVCLPKLKLLQNDQDARLSNQR
jgi:hypothetical protein